MPKLICYKLDDGKYVWTNSLEAFKDTIFERRIIIPPKE